MIITIDGLIVDGTRLDAIELLDGGKGSGKPRIVFTFAPTSNSNTYAITKEFDALLDAQEAFKQCLAAVSNEPKSD